jgi:hypothetical protein
MIAMKMKQNQSIDRAKIKSGHFRKQKSFAFYQTLGYNHNKEASHESGCFHGTESS